MPMPAGFETMYFFNQEAINSNTSVAPGNAHTITYKDKNGTVLGTGTAKILTHKYIMTFADAAGNRLGTAESALFDAKSYTTYRDLQGKYVGTSITGTVYGGKVRSEHKIGERVVGNSVTTSGGTNEMKFSSGFTPSHAPTQAQNATAANVTRNNKPSTPKGATKNPAGFFNNEPELKLSEEAQPKGKTKVKKHRHCIIQ